MINHASEYKFLAENEPYMLAQKKIVVYWHKPPRNWYKLKMGGAFEKGSAVIGGVFITSSRDWILGFNQQVHAMTILHSELLAPQTGLTLAKENEFYLIEVETDSTEVVNASEEG
uniref:RNase H type-1 domain-containing protein n=1 Tax=Nicotiana tabacum TaxID=4097 RepID=A0A1S3YAL3_TOBAC|nr:PREDICTED: uncharacterized protein LOC107774178 [Nicotiana tabacum]